jgi:hypothetical protein
VALADFKQQFGEQLGDFLMGLLTAFQKTENIALIFRGLSSPVSP